MQTQHDLFLNLPLQALKSSTNTVSVFSVDHIVWDRVTVHDWDVHTSDLWRLGSEDWGLFKRVGLKDCESDIYYKSPERHCKHNWWVSFSLPLWCQSILLSRIKYFPFYPYVYESRGMLGTNYDRLHGSIVHIALISLDSQFYPLVQVLKDFYINLKLTVTIN